MQPPVNGTDERLDAVLAELRALRVALERLSAPPAPPDPAAPIALREMARRGRKPKP